MAYDNDYQFNQYSNAGQVGCCKPVTYATEDDINHVNARLSKHASRIGDLEVKLHDAARAGDRELTAAESRIAVLETQVAQLRATVDTLAKHSHYHFVPQVQWVPYPGTQV